MEYRAHRLKTKTEYYNQVKTGYKAFELRKNDRDFQIGDYLFLEEYSNGKYIGSTPLKFEVIYVLNGPLYGLKKGYCIMQLLSLN